MNFAMMFPYWTDQDGNQLPSIYRYIGVEMGIYNQHSWTREKVLDKLIELSAKYKTKKLLITGQITKACRRKAGNESEF